MPTCPTWRHLDCLELVGAPTFSVTRILSGITRSRLSEGTEMRNAGAARLPEPSDRLRNRRMGPNRCREVGQVGDMPLAF